MPKSGCHVTDSQASIQAATTTLCLKKNGPTLKRYSSKL